MNSHRPRRRISRGGGGGGGGMENLTAAQRSLRSAMEKSRAVAAALDETGLRLEEISRSITFLERSLRPARASRGALADIAGEISRAVGPSAAVLKVFDAVHDLEPVLLSDPSHDLSGFLAVVRRLEDALQLLSENCPLAVQWLEAVVNRLEENSLADAGFLAFLRGAVLSLKSSRSPLDGGLLNASLGRLESELRRLLIAPAPPAQELALILDRLAANGRAENCIKIYTEERVAVVRAGLAELGLDYLDISVTDLDDAKRIEDSISRWRQHLDFALKHVLEVEHALCAAVFAAAAAAELCFAEIASQAGILHLLGFGRQVTECRNDPYKLLKLLDVFSTLDNLRGDFNRLFGGKLHSEIQSATRDLIRRVVEGACRIFWELLLQVELQKHKPPPADGGVPKLVVAVAGFCNTLLGEDYRPALAQVLQISHSWRGEKFSPELLPEAIIRIAGALEENLEAWSLGYQDPVQASLFLMNSHRYFHKHLLSTELGKLLGENRLQGHRHYSDYYLEIYIRESWAKLRELLRAKKLREFEDGFEEICRKHSQWIVPEEDLREKIRRTIAQKLVPQYRIILQSCRDEGIKKQAELRVRSMEGMIFSLFPGSSPSSMSKSRRSSNGKISNGVSDERLRLPAPAVI